MAISFSPPYNRLGARLGRVALVLPIVVALNNLLEPQRSLQSYVGNPIVGIIFANAAPR